MWYRLWIGSTHELAVAREFLQNVIPRAFLMLRVQPALPQHAEVMREIL